MRKVSRRGRREILSRTKYQQLIVAGGETSGAVVTKLGLDLLRIGPEIDPGVPWTLASGPNAEKLLLP